MDISSAAQCSDRHLLVQKLNDFSHPAMEKDYLFSFPESRLRTRRSSPFRELLRGTEDAQNVAVKTIALGIICTINETRHYFCVSVITQFKSSSHTSFQ